jgi:type IV pilus biogenesis protein CpaD/CtpE
MAIVAQPGRTKLRNMICRALIVAAAAALLAACAQPPPPVQALPPGPTPAEVIDYSIAQAQYRAAKASGNGDVVAHAENTFRGISQEILSRQDPGLVAAWEVCERYQVPAAPPTQRDVRSTFEPQFVRDCENIDRRYDAATNAIRRDLEARVAGADRATIAQAESGRP